MELIQPDVPGLHSALADKDPEKVRLLVQAGTNVNEIYRQETAFTRAAEEVNSQVDDLCAEEILKSPNFDPNACNQFDQTPLHAVVKLGRDDWAIRLLEKGAKVDLVDVGGLTPLSCCANSDSDACASIMLQHGANANHIDRSGFTPFHRACVKGATKVARLLLRNGSDVNTACDKGSTPLMAAVSFYYHYTFGNKKFTDLLDLCEAIVCAGCDLNVLDKRGKTALHHEVESNNVYGVIFLVEHGCDLNMKNSAGLTAFQSATLPESTKYEVARLLLHYGAIVEGGPKEEGFVGSRESSPIHRVMQGISKHNLNDIAVVYRSLLLQSLSESVFPRYCPHSDGASPSQRSTSHTNQPSASPYNLQRLSDVEHSVSLWANQISGEPCSLQHQAKLRIRAALSGANIVGKIEQLPIGVSMKRYVNLGIPLEQSSIYKEVLLHAAVHSNNIYKVKKIIESGANINATLDGASAFSIALRTGTDDIISELFRHILAPPKIPESTLSGGTTKRSSLGSIDMSADGFASTHFAIFGDTPLHLVAKAGRANYVRQALEICKDHLDARNFAGRTALEEAVGHGHFSTAECLLELGATLMPANNTDEGRPDPPSLLHLAAASGAKRLVELLLEKGANVNATDRFGFTPLRLALGGGRDYLERDIPLPGLYTSELDQALDAVHMTVRISGPMLIRTDPDDHVDVGAMLQRRESQGDDSTGDQGGDQ